jgi:hypothetical protein
VYIGTSEPALHASRTHTCPAAQPPEPAQTHAPDRQTRLAPQDVPSAAEARSTQTGAPVAHEIDAVAHGLLDVHDAPSTHG